LFSSKKPRLKAIRLRNLKTNKIKLFLNNKQIFYTAEIKVKTKLSDKKRIMNIIKKCNTESSSNIND